MTLDITKKVTAFYFALLFLIGTLAANEVEIQPGVTYEHISRDEPLSIHILRVDPTQVTIHPVRAWDFGPGRELLTSIAKRSGAIAAVNGGFFEIGGANDGRPAGILKIHSRWFALPKKTRGAVGWSENSPPIFDRLLNNATESSTMNTIEIVTRPQAAREDIAKWQKVDHIVGGAPLLIKNGIPCSDSETDEEAMHEKFLKDRHPRTAVGTLPNSTWVFVVVDGRSRESIGMTIQELQTFMKNLGCINALNLDGGGSSTMVIENTLVNTPSGDKDEEGATVKKERPISDGIVVTKRRTPGS